MVRSISFLMAALLIGSPAHSRERGTLVGYIAAFKGLGQEMRPAGLDRYTHLVLAFVNPTNDGTIVGPGGLACAPAGGSAMISDAELHALVAAAHERGTKVLASLGGAVIPPCGGDWVKLLSPGMRSTLETNLVDFVERYDIDGLDIDLEGELMMRIHGQGNYVPFVAELAQAMHERSKLLSAATGSYPGGAVPDASLPYLDLLNIMSYDQIGPTWGAPGAEHSTYEQAEADLALWLQKGVRPDKLALGVPFYGRGFGSYRTNWSLAEIASEFGEAQLDNDVVGQRCAGCNYITYNGLGTLERKAKLAGAWGVGLMVWEVGQDLPDSKGVLRLARGYREGRSNVRKQR